MTASRAAGAAQQPAALLYGPAHKIVHANAAFVAEFGLVPIGVPAAEALLDLPPVVLQVVERAIAERRPLATWVDVHGTRRRLTVAPRADIETGEVYGVALGLASVRGRASPASSAER
ncbi:MAG TPA: hypothetical protein VFP19_06055 [Candidatus Limnocylindrales bacterium]|nr:hypothetical protein [Candidatus Limnocylindrales bacterium]